MTPEQIRACRTGLRLTQAEFGQRIGVSRSSAIQYELGRRLDTKQPIEISKATDMSCGAAWLGFDGLTAVLDAADRANSQIGNATPILPSNAVPSWHLEAAIQELTERGFDIGEHHLAFPLVSALAIWTQIVSWCSQRGYSVPKLHPVISSRVPGVAIVEFATANDAHNFKMFCTAGR